MNRRHVAALAFALTVAAGLCHALCYSTMLPDRVATTFDAAGAPIGWASRSTLIDIQLTVIVALAAAVLMVTGAVLRSPARWLRLPNRSWWLAPERSTRTREDLARHVLWLGALTQLLVFDLFHRMVRVNLGRTPALESYWLDVGVFAAITSVWLMILVWRYVRVPAVARSPRTAR